MHGRYSGMTNKPPVTQHLFFWLLMVVIHYSSSPSTASSLVLSTEFIGYLVSFYFCFLFIQPMFLKTKSDLGLLLGLIFSYLLFLFVKNELFLIVNIGNSGLILVEVWDQTLETFLLEGIRFTPIAFFFLITLYEKNASRMLKSQQKDLFTDLCEHKLLKQWHRVKLLQSMLKTVSKSSLQDSREISNILDILSSFYHPLTFSLEQERISLNDELIRINNLLFLHKKRFPDCYYTITTVQHVHGYIPPMILFFLVENALKYASMKTPSTALIISVSRLDNKLSFSITSHIINDSETFDSKPFFSEMKDITHMIFKGKSDFHVKRYGNCMHVVLTMPLFKTRM